jgi:hypothetical protein
LLMGLSRGVRMPHFATSRASSVAEPISRKRAKIQRTFFASASLITSFRSFGLLITV